MAFNTNFFKYLSLYVLCNAIYSKDKLKKFDISKNLNLKSKVCIYGFGPYGRIIFRKLFFFTNIVGIFDISLNKNFSKVLHPDRICDYCFDYIIVTVMNESGRASALRFLSDMNIPDEKVVLLKYSMAKQSDVRDHKMINDNCSL